MCSGVEFHAAGPACEKARSPNLVCSCGSEKSVGLELLRPSLNAGPVYNDSATEGSIRCQCGAI